MAHPPHLPQDPSPDEAASAQAFLEHALAWWVRTYPARLLEPKSLQRVMLAPLLDYLACLLVYAEAEDGVPGSADHVAEALHAAFLGYVEERASGRSRQPRRGKADSAGQPAEEPTRAEGR